MKGVNRFEQKTIKQRSTRDCWRAARAEYLKFYEQQVGTMQAAGRGGSAQSGLVAESKDELREPARAWPAVGTGCRHSMQA